MVYRVETRIFVIKFEKETLRYPGDGWREDLRNVGAEDVSEGLELDNAIRVTFEDNSDSAEPFAVLSDAEIITALTRVVDGWRAKGWVLPPL